jgi:hypothetical protein
MKGEGKIQENLEVRIDLGKRIIVELCSKSCVEIDDTFTHSTYLHLSRSV